LSWLHEAVAANAHDKEAVADVLGAVSAKMFEIYSTLKADRVYDLEMNVERFQEMRNEMQQVHIQGFEREMEEMLELMKIHLYLLFPA
jgi:hypothetical protein